MAIEQLTGGAVEGQRVRLTYLTIIFLCCALQISIYSHLKQRDHHMTNQDQFLSHSVLGHSEDHLRVLTQEESS